MNKLKKWLNGKKTILGSVSGITLTAFLGSKGIHVGEGADFTAWEQVAVAILGALTGTMLPVGVVHKLIKYYRSGSFTMPNVDGRE